MTGRVHTPEVTEWWCPTEQRWVTCPGPCPDGTTHPVSRTSPAEQGRVFSGHFRNGGVIHRLWLWWYGRPMWPWRWLCWLSGNKHDRWGGPRHSYCIVCGKDMP